MLAVVAVYLLAVSLPVGIDYHAVCGGVFTKVLAVVGGSDNLFELVLVLTQLRVVVFEPCDCFIAVVLELLVGLHQFILEVAEDGTDFNTFVVTCLDFAQKGKYNGC